MCAMIEIEWMDGHVRRCQNSPWATRSMRAVQVELDFRFDDVPEGLWVEVRHHEPDEGSDAGRRGRACMLYADCRYGLVDTADLDSIFCVSMRGSRGSAASRGSL